MAQRSKIELSGLLERVLQEYKRGKTLKEIEAILRDEGYDVSRESIRRSIKSSKEIAKLYKQSMDEARVLLEEVRNNTNTDVLETTTSLVANKLFAVAKSLDDLDFSDASAFIEAIQKMSQAQVSMAKLRLSYQKGAEAAKAAVMRELQKALAEHPDIVERIAVIVAGVTVASK